MRRAARQDANHGEIRDAVRKAGGYWFDTFQLKNCCDALVSVSGRIVAVEVKDGNKSPSQQRQTEGEKVFQSDWERSGGRYEIITTTDEALALVAELKEMT
jgi:hypothetical protein